MFLTKKGVKEAIREELADSEGASAKILKSEKEITRLTNEISELKFKKELEEKEIKHLVKMKEEKQTIETEKKHIELSKNFQQREMELQKEYFEKVMSNVKDGHKKMEEIYAKILERLPNVNMEIEKRVR